MQHAAQLLLLPTRLCRHAAEHDLLALDVANLRKENLERASLILTSRSHVTAVNRERNRFRRHRRPGRRRLDGLLFQPGTNAEGSLGVVSTVGASSGGRNSDNNVRARR
jgi:hypothetical protein